MVGSFYIHLLSNTRNVTRNKTSQFTVRLPRKLEFNSAWRVGLMSIIYPYSWPNIGTAENQFIDIYWSDKTVTRIPLTTSGYASIEDLLKRLNADIAGWQTRMCVLREKDVDEPATKRARRSDSLLAKFRKSLEQVHGDPNLTPEQLLSDVDAAVLHRGDMDRRFIVALRALHASQQLRTTLQTNISELNEKINSLSTQLKDGVEDRRKLEKEKEKLTLDLTTLRKEKKEMQDEYKIDVMSARNAETTWKRNYDDKHAQYKALEERHRQQGQKLFEEQLEKKRLEGEKLTTQEQALLDLNAKSTQIDAANKQLEGLQAQLNAYKLKEEELKRLQESHTKLVNQRDNLQDRINELNALKTTDEATIKNLRSKITKLERDALATSRTNVQEKENFGGQLEKVRDELTAREDVVKRLNITIEVLQTRIRELEAFNPDAAALTGFHADAECVPPKGALNIQKFGELQDKLKFETDQATGRVVFKVNNAQISMVRLSEQLRFVLGFEQRNFTDARNLAKYSPDLHGGVHSLFIYAPGLIEPAMVGDTSTPLLRIAKVKGKHGDMVEDTFLSPLYHKVMEKSITDISIEIRTSTERLVPFDWGDCILVLHFVKDSVY